ncbi:MAG: hypothetical protein NVSMB1_20660 [Polyangiales bacterium]
MTDSADEAPIAPRNDFVAPVLDAGVTGDPAKVFAVADKPGMGPCLYEPELGSLFPRNWLRPRFRFNAAGGENLFQITLQIPNETSPLVVYTTKTSWTMDKSIWQTIAQIGIGRPIHVTVRSAKMMGDVIAAGPFLGSQGDIEVAPVEAEGSVVYWTTSDGSVLKGFKIGDETVRDVIRPSMVGTGCVACHSSTPDGKYVGYSARDGAAARDRFDLRSVDGTLSAPPWLTASAKKLLGRSIQEAPVFSKAHWTTGDRIAISVLGDTEPKSEIIWTDLEATSEAAGVGWGTLARADGLLPALPQFSHDGNTIAYFAGPAVQLGVIASNGADVFTLAYNNRKGGGAKPLPGASDPKATESLPSFSPDDKYLAFNRVDGLVTTYNNPNAEVFVIPSGGGTPTRLTANDPPVCLGKKSPGMLNSWARWAPEVKSFGGSDYYFVVFSSIRNAASAGAQLYIAPIVVKGGVITSYAALYLWNQPEMEHNHTPAWDVIKLPGPK